MNVVGNWQNNIDNIDVGWLYRWDGGYGWRQRILMEVGDMAYFLKLG